MLTNTNNLKYSHGIFVFDDMKTILEDFFNFQMQDIVIFDVDDVIEISLDPRNYYSFNTIDQTNFYKKLFFQNKIFIKNFFFYVFLTKKRCLVDTRLPKFINNLQERNILCIANTALQPIINKRLSLDLPKFRLNILRELGINFFLNTVNNTAKKYELIFNCGIFEPFPLFKEGIIFSGKTPKYKTVLETVIKLNLLDSRIFFIDNNLKNVQEVYYNLNKMNIKCIAIHYSRIKSNDDYRSYFSDDEFSKYLIKLEKFFCYMMKGKDIEPIFRELNNNSNHCLV